jgi:hypothetical protein
MVSLSPTESYRMLMFNELPVREQCRVKNQIKVTFYDGTEKFVSERDWRTQSRQVFVPKNFGTRKHVATNWDKYHKFCHH